MRTLIILWIFSRHSLGFLRMWSALGDVGLVGLDLGLDFLLFGSIPINISIHIIILLINYGKWNWHFPKATKYIQRILQEPIIFQVFTLNTSRTNYNGMHEDMQILKLGGDVGTWNWHLFALIFLPFLFTFLFLRAYSASVTTIINLSMSLFICHTYDSILLVIKLTTRILQGLWFVEMLFWDYTF